MGEEMEQIAVAEGAPTCASCDISIGPDSLEQESYPVGDYKLCSFCLSRLERNGRVLLQPYHPTTGLFLFADGHTESLPLKGKN